MTYRVAVNCTNHLNDTCCNRTEEQNEYFDCKHGVLYVVTDDPKKIYDKFGLDTVSSITEIGIGYTL